ncbi:MAG: type II toxin-antitoxin system HicB family antitoxin [Gemmatimonadaceae bacterium]
MNQYLVVMERTTTGYGVYIPDLPGCVSTGRTKAQAARNAREAIELHLEGLREEGQPIPKASSTATFVTVVA